MTRLVLLTAIVLFVFFYAGCQSLQISETDKVVTTDQEINHALVISESFIFSVENNRKAAAISLMGPATDKTPVDRYRKIRGEMDYDIYAQMMEHSEEFMNVGMDVKKGNCGVYFEVNYEYEKDGKTNRVSVFLRKNEENLLNVFHVTLK